MASNGVQGNVLTPFPNPTNGQFLTDGAQVVALETQANQGATLFSFNNIGGAAYTKQQVKASQGTVFKLHVQQTNAVALWLQLFDVLSGNVTPGTTVPNLEYALAASSDTTIALDPGWLFLNGLTIFCSTAEKGGTGTAAGVRTEVLYK